MTLKGQVSKFDLRSSQAKVTWWLKWVILHISRFAWPRPMYGHQSHASDSFGSKVFGKWLLVTSGDLKWPFEGWAMQFFTWIVNNCPIRCDSTQIRLRQSKYNGVDFLPIDLLWGGRKNDLTWGHRSKIRDIRFVGTDDLIIFRKFHNSLKHCSRGAVGNLFCSWVTWPDLVTWPCMTPANAWLNWPSHLGKGYFRGGCVPMDKCDATGLRICLSIFRKLPSFGEKFIWIFE